MKITIPTTEMAKLMQGLFARVPAKKAILKISAADGKLVLQCAGSVAGTSVKMVSPGEVTLAAKPFYQVLATFKSDPTIDLQGSPGVLRINSFTMPVSSFNAAPTLPSEV